MRYDHDRDLVADHLTQQAHGEVVRMAVRELVDAIERQRAGEDGVRGRDRRAGARHPVLRPHGLPGQLLKSGPIDEPDAGRCGKDHNLPPCGLARSDQRGYALGCRGAADHQVQHADRSAP